MEAVAEHINEMQKIYEEYGCILDELSKQFRENNPHSRVFNFKSCWKQTLMNLMNK